MTTAIQHKHVVVLMVTSLLSTVAVVGLWIDTSLAIKQLGASIQRLSSLDSEAMRSNYPDQQDATGNDGRVTTHVEAGVVLDTSAIISAIRSELKPLNQRMSDLEVRIGSLAASYRRGPVPSDANYAVPSANIMLPSPNDFQANGAPSLAGGNVSPESLTIFHKVLNENAERVQQRIAAETDFENPDPAVIQRIMFESQADIAYELSTLLPKEDYEAVLPPVMSPKVTH